MDETTKTKGNSSFNVTNDGMIDVSGSSAYGIHLEFLEDEETDIVTSDSTEADPIYAYPDINISKSGLEEIDKEINIYEEVTAELKNSIMTDWVNLIPMILI